MPGSKKAARECLQMIACTIPHAVSLIRDEKEITKQFHNQCNSRVDTKTNIPVCKISIIQYFIYFVHYEYVLCNINMHLIYYYLKYLMLTHDLGMRFKNSLPS